MLKNSITNGNNSANKKDNWVPHKENVGRYLYTLLLLLIYTECPAKKSQGGISQ